MTNTANSNSRRRETADDAGRRRRKDRGEVVGQRLGVNKSMLDFDNFAYRWIKDTPARIFAKTREDDWDIVKQDGTAVKDDAETDAAVYHFSGTHPDGSPMRLYLCRKPIAYYNADREEKMAALERQRAQLAAGNDRSGQALADYVPNEGIRI